jgi:ABC-type polysaccharide/polyol phosphate export permease
VNIFSEINEIYRYRELLRNLVLRDIKKRYKRSALGFLWVMLDPLLMMLVFYFVFAGFFGGMVVNYTAYVISGITMWQLFAQGTKVSSTAFLYNRSLINKISLPKSIFPVSVVISALVHFTFSLVPLFFIIIISGTRLSYNLISLPLVVLSLFIFSVGISLIISSLSVFFHDFVYIYDVFIMAWMYLSAIFYPVSILPERFQLLMAFNPVYHYISLFRACLYDSSIPKTEHFIWAVVFAAVSFLIGCAVYHKSRDRIIFYL